MAVNAKPPEDSTSAGNALGEEVKNWVARLAWLQEALTACPTDILARCELATMFERLEQHEEALLKWRAVLASDPNNLKALEGLARCRRRTGRPLQSSI